MAAAIPPPMPRPIGHADRIVVEKRDRVLKLIRRDEVVREFRIALGRQPEGPKERQGDYRTPEGTYEVAGFNPDSYFHRAILISYPNAADVARAGSMGVSPGGSIMIHGLDPAIAAKWREDHWLFNWTRGCIAVTDREMDEIWQSVALGTPIEIRP